MMIEISLKVQGVLLVFWNGCGKRCDGRYVPGGQAAALYFYPWRDADWIWNDHCNAEMGKVK